MATALPYIMAASSFVEGMGAQQEANFSARVKDQQAQQELVAAAEKERDFKLQQEQALGEYRAAAGAGGVNLDAGSVLSSFVNFKGEEALQATRINQAGKISAMRLRQGAELDRMAGRNAMFKGVMRAGSSLLTGLNPPNVSGVGRAAASGTISGAGIGAGSAVGRSLSYGLN
jgi:hypothetical protein